MFWFIMIYLAVPVFMHISTLWGEIYSLREYDSDRVVNEIENVILWEVNKYENHPNEGLGLRLSFSILYWPFFIGTDTLWLHKVFNQVRMRLKLLRDLS